MVRAKIWNRKPGLEASANISCLLVDLTRVYRLVTMTESTQKWRVSTASLPRPTVIHCLIWQREEKSILHGAEQCQQETERVSAGKKAKSQRQLEDLKIQSH